MPSLVRIETTGTRETAAELTALGAQAPLAAARALNRTRVGVMALLLRTLNDVTGLPQARLRKSMRTFAATPERLETTITVYGGRDPLIKYAPAVQTQHLPERGFKRRMPGSGHVGYFERAPGSRHRRKGEPFAPHELPIHEIYGPRITEFITDATLADIEAYGTERLAAEMAREVNFRLSKQGAA